MTDSLRVDPQNIADAISRYIKESPVLTFSKESPDAGDVHTNSAGGGAKRRKKPSDGMRSNNMNSNISYKACGDVIKVDESLGLVFGWAIICKKDGEDYFDLQEDNIPEFSMLKASVNFMQNSRIAREMHDGDAKGSVVFAFPMTTDVAKSFNIETATTGLMIAIKPESDEMLAKFRDGTFTGFSIGGQRLIDKEVD